MRTLVEARKNDYRKNTPGNKHDGSYHEPGSNKKPCPHKRASLGEVLSHAGSKGGGH